LGSAGLVFLLGFAPASLHPTYNKFTQSIII